MDLSSRMNFALLDSLDAFYTFPEVKAVTKVKNAVSGQGRIKSVSICV